MTPYEISSDIMLIISRVAGKPALEKIGDHTTLDALEIDSLRVVEIVVDCERAYGVRIPICSIMRTRTIGDLVRAIRLAAERS